MKALFMDVDGVLNTFWSREQDKINGMSQRLDPEKVELIHDLKRRTGCKIILTSTWRLFEANRARLQSVGLWTPVAGDGQTRALTPADRGMEIVHWFNDHLGPDVEGWAIVDDNPISGFDGHEWFVRTQSHIGLTKQHTNHLLSIFEGQIMRNAS